MKLIQIRKNICLPILAAAIFIAMLPLIGLLTGTAFSTGLYGANYQEASLDTDPRRYWFMIKLELAIVAFLLFRAKFTFPLFHATYVAILNFRENHKFIANFILYLIVPVIVVAFCIFLIAYFEL